MSNFIVADRKTDYLLLLSLDDWLNEDHWRASWSR